MTKLSDFSKFDNIDTNSDDDNGLPASTATARPSQQLATACSAPKETVKSPSGTATMHKDPKTGRYVFQYSGRDVYQWEQTLDDVTIFVTAPPHVTKAKQLNVEIQPNHLKLGLVGGSHWYLDEPTFGTVDVAESTWSLEDEDSGRMITIYLTKAHRGDLWDAALKGKSAVQLDPLSKENVKKKLMLERFQEENPGFDFSDAQFNGGIPDARSFMGGVKYN